MGGNPSLPIYSVCCTHFTQTLTIRYCIVKDFSNTPTICEHTYGTNVDYDDRLLKRSEGILNNACMDAHFLILLKCTQSAFSSRALIIVSQKLAWMLLKMNLQNTTWSFLKCTHPVSWSAQFNSIGLFSKCAKQILNVHAKDVFVIKSPEQISKVPIHLSWLWW